VGVDAIATPERSTSRRTLIVIALGVIPAGLLGPDSAPALTSAVTGLFAWNK